jgi:uncharacterized protein (DUF3084 family)
MQDEFNEHDKVCVERDALRAELEALRAENNALRAKNNALRAKNNALLADKREMLAMWIRTCKQHVAQCFKNDKLREKIEAQKEELKTLWAAHEWTMTHLH